METLQLIDENKVFSPNVNDYVSKTNVSQKGLDYHLISVFGSQSTGKSTLLNALFGTNFGVMDAKVTRRQTTKGIWMGVDTSTSTPTIVLDVEGTDGRERGEDQDFERKAALFALATSEILIINMWENQVGLYVGANMPLLRTVFEVNLSLFQSGHGNRQKSKLLFVLRDYVGVTPLESLAKALYEDLEKQWESLSKPAGLEFSTVYDFFDLDIAGLPHRLLQEESFNKEVKELRKKLSLSVNPEYHRNVPIDGWSVYAEKIWEQIEMNKDLDLPTHQILVSRFRCEEIADEVFKKFEAEIAGYGEPFGDEVVISNFGKRLEKVRSKALANYDETAGRYYKSVYNEKRLELLGRIDGILTAYFGAQLSAIKAEAVETFWKRLNALASSEDGQKLTFGERIKASVAIAHDKFVHDASEAVIDPSFFSYHAQEVELDAELKREAAKARKSELKKLLKRISKKLSNKLDHVNIHFDMYPQKLENPWDATLESLRSSLESVLKEYPVDLGLGGTPEETAHVFLSIEAEAWRVLASKIASFTTPDAVLQRMRDRFEEAFRYTPEGLPVVWSPGDDIDAAGVKALKKAQTIIPVFSSAKLSDGNILAIPEEVSKYLHQEEEDVPDFEVLLTLSDRQGIERRFQRVADAAFIDAKRSMIQGRAHIPMYIFVIIAVLGWNEFVAVLRNPLLVLLCALIGGGVYVIYHLGMTDATLNIASATANRLATEAKQYIRELVMTDEEKVEYRKKNRKLSEMAENVPNSFAEDKLEKSSNKENDE